MPRIVLRNRIRMTSRIKIRLATIVESLVISGSNAISFMVKVKERAKAKVSVKARKVVS